MIDRDDDDHDDQDRTCGLPPLEHGLPAEEVHARLQRSLLVGRVNAVSVFDQLMAQLRDVLPLMSRCVENSGVPNDQRMALIEALCDTVWSAITGLNTEDTGEGAADVYLRTRDKLLDLERYAMEERVQVRAYDLLDDLPGDDLLYCDFIFRHAADALDFYGDCPTDAQLRRWLLDSPPGKAARGAG